ncbi:alpha/beta-hydrolase [Rhizoclosmatium globosum]|uniref:Alpha/beta-hydrolase n=1 Tax=Rhizoclosmatium globosum TaxID=329046 RepID=A0A1Y2CSR2_9FUNG|nr:alpha/beta-hydrolase [Rhizoclosmatium globosum]|eukprot:ORY50078.1 alpha/beta-hydrolase [Rhizoclosmatium globosum]
MKEDSCVTLYLHGGAHMIGSPGSHRDLISSLSKSVNGPVLAIDYKKSPDAMFPVAIFEAIQAYRNLLTENPSCIYPTSSKFFINPNSPYKFKPSQIVVMGDSSGGCLTLQTLLLIADLGLPTPKCAVLMSPQTDMLMSSETMTSNWDSDILCFDRVGYVFGKIAYAGERFSPVHPVVSPCYQTDFRGLPPVLIQVGDAEVLLGDTKRLFEGMRRYGGVDVEMQVWKDCFHVWHAFAGFIGDAAHEAINEVGEFVRRVEGFIECRNDDRSTKFVTLRNGGKVIKVEGKRRKRRVGKS